MSATLPPLAVESMGALCAAGSNAAQVAAITRSGLGVASASAVHDRFFAPMTMALFPEDELPPLQPALEKLSLTARQRRMLRLAGSPLAEASNAFPAREPLPLFLGLPEPRPGLVATASLAFLEHLCTQAAVELDLSHSQTFAKGRAAAFVALAAAASHLRAGKSRAALVGGVDSHLDLAHLAELDSEGRLHGERVPHGFIPGEGAAFFVVSLVSGAAGGPSASAKAKRNLILATAISHDPGHLRSAEPARGEGLSAALETLRQGSTKSMVVGRVLAGFNGEPFFAKEWGVARLRHGDLFAKELVVDHPADCYGDLGAATGAMLLVLACQRLGEAGPAAPVLAFASSDFGDCGVSVLSRPDS